MTTEIIWKELSCPLLEGGLCVQSSCIAATCGGGNSYPIYDTVEEKIVKTPKTEKHHFYDGWWIFRKRITETKTTYVEEKLKRIHLCKKIITSYIVCTQHSNNNIGIKITVENDDKWQDWMTDTNHEWFLEYYIHVDKIEEKIQELRDSINRDCIYDTLE